MKKLFTNDIFFAIVTWFAVIATIPYAIVGFVCYNDPMIWIVDLLRIIMMACLVVTYVSYKKHAKNVMKGMMGAVLMCAVITVMIPAFIYTDYAVESWIAFGLVALLFITHFIINSDHHSSPAFVLFNQILSFVITGLLLVEGIVLIPASVNTADMITQIIMSVAQPCFLLSIICIESLLDSFRKDREAAGWTEEKGYPENYVHEYQKNK